jgi:cadmium resistance protein CadD (predicted permease)
MPHCHRFASPPDAPCSRLSDQGCCPAESTVPGVYVLVFAVLVGIWCMAARAVAGQTPLIRMVERIGHWLVPVVYIAIGIRIIVTSGLFGT